jgi:hypothetical protein
LQVIRADRALAGKATPGRPGLFIKKFYRGEQAYQGIADQPKGRGNQEQGERINHYFKGGVLLEDFPEPDYKFSKFF